MDWTEYDAAAKWCAQRGLKGVAGDPLPAALSTEVFEEINQHPEEFEQRVKDTAYAMVMESITRRGSVT